MKKIRNDASRAVSKVMLRRETIAALTVGHLGQARGGDEGTAAGGDTSFVSCLNTQCPTRDPV